MKSFQLLKTRKFGPFFWTQFLGAFNDNAFKNALVIMIAFKAASEAESGFYINLASGLFILPFFLFSPLAGQLSDKFDKAALARIIKIAEIPIMALGALGFYLGNRDMLLVVLFLMGAQSSFFGPLKYAILPQTLEPDELVSGNAMVELGTFVAILVGTIVGGVVVAEAPNWVGATVVFFAILGLIASMGMPKCPSVSPDLKINYGFFSEVLAMFRLARKERSVNLSILGISWFWFYGAIFLSQIPTYTKTYLGGNESVVTLFLATFSISIGIGSLICEKLSRGDIELGLIPFGAFGMSVFAIDLYFVSLPAIGTEVLTFAKYFGAGNWSYYRILIDFAGVGVFGSFYTLPLYALVQKRSPPSERSRIIAWLNIDNSIFIVVSALLAMVLYKIGMSTVEILLVVGILNFFVATYIFFLIPEFLFRFILWILASTIYRIRFEGRDRFPTEGAVLIVANHTSFIDWMVVTAACRRPARFVMDHTYFFNPIIKWFFKLAKAVPIAPSKESEEIKKRAFDLISAELQDGQVVCIFPEGMITHDGKLNGFRPGLERILAQNPVPVIPVSVHGLWGSFFSRHKGRAMKGVPKPTWRKVEVKVGEALPPTTSAKTLEDQIRKMLIDSEAENASLA